MGGTVGICGGEGCDYGALRARRGKRRGMEDAPCRAGWMGSSIGSGSDEHWERQPDRFSIQTPAPVGPESRNVPLPTQPIFGLRSWVRLVIPLSAILASN